MNQQGVTFLEIVVVIAILMITSALVAPSIQDWRQKRAVESDYLAVLAQIDYLKVRARTLNGTALLICNGTNGSGNKITYKVSKNNQTNTDSISGSFGDEIVETTDSNILSGNSEINSDLCNQNSGAIFLASGRTGVVDQQNTQIEIKVLPATPKSNFSAYRVRVNKSTGFIEKSKGKYGQGGITINWDEYE